MPVRRTQEERSAATRARLLEATLDCLADLGYAGTTTTEVADRAGVSRGAQLHHYPTKAELVTAAVAHLFDCRDREFRKAITALPAGAARATASIDLLWKMVSGRTFYAWLELAVAARTDRELRRAMRKLSERTTRTIERTFRELFAPPAKPNPLYELAPTFTFALMHGVALEQLVIKDHRGAEIIQSLKLLATLVFPRARSS